MTDFNYLGSRITVDHDCSHKTEMLVPWKETYDKPCCCCSVAQTYLTLQPIGCSMPGNLALHHLPELDQIHVHWLVMPSNHLVLCRSLLLWPSIFPSIRVFSNESVLCIMWPNYQSFTFGISTSNEYSGLISFRTD